MALNQTYTTLPKPRWLPLALWGSAIAILAFGAWAVGPGAARTVQQLDQSGLELAHSWRSPALDQTMETVTWLGSLWLLLPATLLASAILLRSQCRRDALFLVFSLVGASLLSHLTKMLVMRPRPDLFPVWTAMPSDWSFPSAHTMQATAIALALLLLVAQRHAVWIVASAGGVLLVGFSRVYLQVHFPSDVIIGAVTAGLWVIGLYLLMYGRERGHALMQAGGDKP